MILKFLKEENLSKLLDPNDEYFNVMYSSQQEDNTFL